MHESTEVQIMPQPLFYFLFSFLLISSYYYTRLRIDSYNQKDRQRERIGRSGKGEPHGFSLAYFFGCVHVSCLKPILGILETIRLSFSFPRRVVVPFDSVLSLIVCPLVDTTKQLITKSLEVLTRSSTAKSTSIYLESKRALSEKFSKIIKHPKVKPIG